MPSKEWMDIFKEEMGKSIKDMLINAYNTGLEDAAKLAEHFDDEIADSDHDVFVLIGRQIRALKETPAPTHGTE